MPTGAINLGTYQTTVSVDDIGDDHAAGHAHLQGLFRVVLVALDQGPGPSLITPFRGRIAARCLWHGHGYRRGGHGCLWLDHRNKHRWRNLDHRNWRRRRRDSLDLRNWGRRDQKVWVAPACGG